MTRRFFVWAAILSLFFDQVSKVMAYGLLHEHVPLRVLGNVLRFSLTSNPQGLFGLSFGPPIIYFLLPVLGIGLVVYFALRSPDCWLATAYGMILGGAIGNLVDRVRLGYVIDFIDIGIRRCRWYTFNLADAFVIIGILLLLGREIFARRKGMSG
ncbi:signal peptidase II [candidate division WOR-3 bacterium JGI_Cruoil_03_51_56]|uniref:Lipoprotein signal peptidase n=1 Tax=candidate division WOR-3 bacterium JGI_Cruoil_03_51_56 TaxID=1973747 RepID=A0A235BR70_UNCW3|nr:MAG: signal peptidase II [candidate division WOR-3 bacterium JGI_Cruoil_03_51_56]